MSEREPIFNVPAAVVAVIALLVVVHVGLSFLDQRQEERWLLTLAFIPARYAGLADQLPGGNIALATSFVTHMLVHGDWIHLAMNCVWLLAFGGAVALRLGNLRFLLFVVLTGVAGALLFLAFNWARPVPVVGASGAVSGLMAGAFRFFFSAREGQHHAGLDLRTVPLMSLGEVFRNRTCLTVIGVWVALNGVMGVLGTALTGGAGIAWEAHLGGFLAGLLTFGAFDRGVRRLEYEV